MKNKMLTVYVASLILALSACGMKQPSRETADNPVGTSAEMAQEVVSNTAQDTTTPTAVTGDPFANADFKGKVHSCVYAEESKVMVLADELYLYDVLNGRTIAKAPTSLNNFEVSSFAGGYLVSGTAEGGVTGYLYDKKLSNVREIKFYNLIKEDIIISEECIAISEDGGTIAITGLKGLYIYNLSTDKVSTLISYGEKAVVNSIEIGTIDSLAFTGTNELTFTGSGYSVPVKVEDKGFSIYGTIGLDGAIRITKKASYTVSDLLTGGNVVMLPQDFTKNNGTLLTVDLKTGKERTYSFSTSREGKDGVFCSINGNYFATAELEDNLTIRIYETQSGELCHTEVVSNADSTYFYRIPQVLMLDKSRTCIVLLGRGLDEVNTLIKTFNY